MATNRDKNIRLAVFMGETGHSHKYAYDSNWNALMPVIQKISQHRYVNYDKGTVKFPTHMHYAWPRTFGMISENGGYMFRFNCAPLHEAETLIEAAFEACVEWVDMYLPDEIIFDPLKTEPCH